MLYRIKNVLQKVEEKQFLGLESAIFKPADYCNHQLTTPSALSSHCFLQVQLVPDYLVNGIQNEYPEMSEISLIADPTKNMVTNKFTDIKKKLTLRHQKLKRPYS